MNPALISGPAQYDALLIVSFGGPEGVEDVIPFLENVLRGRNVPPGRLLEVAEHYYRFGGKSPLNDQTRALIAGLRQVLAGKGPHLPIYWGNRNWRPFLADTLRQMRADGVKRALAFFTSAFSSYSGCRQYRENIVNAQLEAGEGAPEVHKLRAFYNHPGFLGPVAENVKGALKQIPPERRPSAHVAFTAHSIPLAMAQACDYQVQLEDACSIVAKIAGLGAFALVYQSRGGPPGQPWLEPDIAGHLRALHAQGVRDVVVMPIGFISDHMEVLYDLDTEAAKVAKELGMGFVRAATAGTHPDFIEMIRQLILERMDASVQRLALGERGPAWDVCAEDCCTFQRNDTAPSGAVAPASERTLIAERRRRGP